MIAVSLEMSDEPDLLLQIFEKKKQKSGIDVGQGVKKGGYFRIFRINLLFFLFFLQNICVIGFLLLNLGREKYHLARNV